MLIKGPKIGLLWFQRLLDLSLAHMEEAKTHLELNPGYIGSSGQLRPEGLRQVLRWVIFFEQGWLLLLIQVSA